MAELIRRDDLLPVPQWAQKHYDRHTNHLALTTAVTQAAVDDFLDLATYAEMKAMTSIAMGESMAQAAVAAGRISPAAASAVHQTMTDISLGYTTQFLGVAGNQMAREVAKVANDGPGFFAGLLGD